MATLPIAEPVPAKDAALDAAAAKMAQLVEEYYDEIGLSEAERDARYASAREFLDSKIVATSRP